MEGLGAGAEDGVAADTGVGALMCCLKYEQDYYSQTLKKLPKVGKDIVTPDGVGVLAEINAIRERVKVRIKIDEDFDVREYAIDEVRRPGPDDSAATPARSLTSSRKSTRPLAVK